MAFTFAGQYTEVILGTSSAGFAVALPALSVHVYTVGTTTHPTLYTSRTKGTTTANPTTTDANGNLTFYVDPGQYDIVFTPPGGSQKRITVTVPADPAESSAAYVQQRNNAPTGRGAVIFCIDDCKTTALPLIAIHDALNQKVTLGVCSALANTGGFMSTAQITAAWQNGHELANHTDTHPNYTAITAAQRRTETDNCNAFITGITGQAPKSFIYPQGAWSAVTDRELYGTFRNWRATLSSGTNLPWGFKPGDTNPRYYAVDVGDPLNYTRAQELIRLAAVSPVVVSTYIHYADDVGVITSAQYQALAQLAYDLGVPVVQAQDYAGSKGMVGGQSFETTGMPMWFPTVTGAATVTQATITPDAGIAGTKGCALTATQPDSALVSQPVVVTPGVTYRFSGRVLLQAGGTLIATNDFFIRTKWRDWTEAAISSNNVFPTLAAAGTWTRFESDFVAPAGARFAWLDISVAPGVAGRGGTVIVDHVDFRPSDQGGLG